MQTAKRNIAKTDLPNGLWVSTVFLGLDHQFEPGKPPLIFETMVFAKGSWSDIYCRRYSTRAEAVAWARTKVRKAGRKPASNRRSK